MYVRAVSYNNYIFLTDNKPSSEPSACVDISMLGGDSGWSYGVVELASDRGSGMLV